MQSHINVGFDYDVTIKDLAEMIVQVICCQRKITFETKLDHGPINL
jgi:hypothetical protein